MTASDVNQQEVIAFLGTAAAYGLAGPAVDRDFRKYVILGACNPPLADRALHAELEVGLLLPCNVIVYEDSPGGSVVSAMAPMAALGIVGDNAELQAVAEDADARLRRALTTLEVDARS